MPQSAICCAIFLVFLSSPCFSVVRKVNSDRFERTKQVSYSEESAARGAVHCVVWFDGLLDGSIFKTREEAGEFFEKLRRTELAAIQYDNLHEVSSFMSTRLKSVNWAKTKEWCERNRHAPHTLSQGVPANASTHDGSSSIVQQNDSSFAEPIAPSLSSAYASTLTDKVNLVEKKLSFLGSQASTLLRSIGLANTHASPTSLFEVGTASGGHLGRQKNRMKLKKRLDAVEGCGAFVEENVNRLEIEFFGSSKADKPLASKMAKVHTIKRRIDALAAQADELRDRLSGLTDSALLKDIFKLEEKIAALGPKAADIFRSIGVIGAEGAQKAAALATRKGGNLTERLEALESLTGGMRRGVVLLEYELLGNSSWNSSSPGAAKARSIKEHAVSLGSKLGDLENRLATLEVAPAMKDVDKLEGAIVALFYRAATLSKRTGVASKLPEDVHVALAPRSSAVKPRIVALEAYASKMQDATASLEEQLADSIGTKPAQSRKDNVKGQLTFLELQTENMDARMSALEQQV